MRRWLVAAGVVLLVMILAGWWLFWPHRPAASTGALAKPEGELNVLVIGSDARAVGPVRYEGVRRNRREERSHSDIIIVCHISYDRPSLNLVGIPRDLLVEVPGITRAESPTDFPRMEKITHVLAIGGEPLLRRTVEHLLGIKIHRFIAFDFDSFRMTIGLLRPFLGVLRIGGEAVKNRDHALWLARRRHGLPFDDADRCRNAVGLVRTVIARGWYLGRSRFGREIIRRVLQIVGEDTDLTVDEIVTAIDGLSRAGMVPGRIQTAVLVAEGRDVLLERYNQLLSCYLPVYREIERQVRRFLFDEDSVPALDFMTQQAFALPAYFARDYTGGSPDSGAKPPPFDTTGLDSSRRVTLTRELQELQSETAGADTGRR